MDYNEMAETLKSIKTRPGLYIRKYPDFDIANSFIDGYLTAWAYSYNLEQKDRGHSIWRDIQKWYCGESNKKINRSLPLPDIIKEQYFEYSEEDLIQKYIDVLIEFFRFKINEK